MISTLSLPFRALIAALSGALLSIAFLPFDLWAAWASPVMALFPVIALLPLLYFWRIAPSPREAFKMGFAFGVGFFAVGTHWVFVSMTTFGGMAPVVAIFLLLLFFAYLSLFPAFVGFIAVRYFDPSPRMVALPALWGLSELLRGTLFSGFPWLSLGYTQATFTPFSGFIPFGGVYLSGMAIVAVSAAVIAFFTAPQRRHKIAVAAFASIVLVIGQLTAFIEWSAPATKEIPVTLIQGNVPQDVKFLPSFKESTYTRYGDLLEESRGALILLPESAFPDFLDLVPEETVNRFARYGVAENKAIMLGVFTYERNTITAREEYYNSIVSLGSVAPQLYRKRHLVLFGEKIPFESVIAPLMNWLISIPLAGQAEGANDQPPFTIGDQKIAVSICFEDAFGAEQRARVRQSTMLANFTNDAWFGRSIAAWQHHRIATIRALESARPMLRVTNTGVTSVIDHQGRTRARLPWFTESVLESAIIGRAGNTLYLIAGDWIVFIMALVILLALTVRKLPHFRNR